MQNTHHPTFFELNFKIDTKYAIFTIIIYLSFFSEVTLAFHTIILQVYLKHNYIYIK